MSDLTIRPLVAADRPAWDQLWQAYLAYYETELPGAVYDTAFERLLSGDPHEFAGLIAEQDGVAVGLTHYLFHRRLWSIEDTCYLMDLYVSPDCRGGGVGRQLIEAVHERAKAAGIPDVYWLTQEFNYKGRMLYDKVATRTPFIKYAKRDPS
ncbi:GNAT family N-acetyltransferase [Aliiroseovarius marinus]|uniref:GNAT family N-acetyltransferase n=1 Tax=Aliiroseovarius marinus TaxID=2500159 RepID=UPI003D7E4C90